MKRIFLFRNLKDYSDQACFIKLNNCSKKVKSSSLEILKNKKKTTAPKESGHITID